MGYLTSSSTSGVNSHLYSQALQMKLYQGFIFSIPVLFSVILFLLFYLFYLKKTFSNSNSSSSSSINHPRNSRNQDSSTLPQFSETGSKINLEDKLIVILFDEDLYTEDSMCCVCLGEFEINEKLHQIPACKHMFHGDCIRNWLYSNITCPLCRCSVVNTAKSGQHVPPVVPEPATVTNMSLNLQGVPLEHSVVIFEGSSSSGMDNKLSHPNEECVVVNIQIQDS
ncbi:Zinc finger, RING/FYVE/PHD-type [Artemisia annua]|uniref:RING-type E3 ubiquitin transferase n=1 Tax=Artemisia annua TaxID=35608 RepID=A0A2U1LQ72_ARTAN|nr:Zinc finger, RING/FYVE/PHD-type [Artemisia annua]